jgi:hypothetical protein
LPKPGSRDSQEQLDLNSSTIFESARHPSVNQQIKLKPIVDIRIPVSENKKPFEEWDKSMLSKHSLTFKKLEENEKIKKKVHKLLVFDENDMSFYREKAK